MNNIADDTKLNHVYKLLHSRIALGQSKIGTKLPTEHDLAIQLGYSRATVARAIRMLVDEGLVERRKRAGSFVRGKQTEALVFAAMIGHTLPAQRSDNVFVAVSHEIAHQAEINASALLVHDPGFKVTNKSDLISRTSQITKQLVARNISGVFILPDPIDEGEEDSLSAKTAAEFDRAQIPVVLLDRDVYRYPKRSKYDVVGLDNKRAGYLLTQHLISLGCRRIDFIAPASYASAADERLQGYMQCLWANNIEPERKRTHSIEHTSRDDAETGLRPECIEQVLRQSDAEAFVVANDGMAAEVMQIALAIGKRIPDDIRLVGFDDLPQSKYLSVPLTTIRQPCEALGTAAMWAMLERMRSPDEGGREIMLRSELIVRESCGAGR